MNLKKELFLVCFRRFTLCNIILIIIYLIFISEEKIQKHIAGCLFAYCIISDWIIQYIKTHI